MELYAQPQKEPGLDFDFSYYWYLLWRRRWHIATITIAGTVIVSLLMLALPKKYRSTAIVRIDPQGRSTVGQNNSQNGVDPTLLVTTEQQVVTSPAVVSELIEHLDLADNPEFAPKGYHGGGLTALQRNEVMKAVTGAISVGQPIDTLLLQIGFTARNPDLAARAANELSHVYLEHEYATRAQALSDASKNMGQQLDTLRAQMEQAQSALVTYESTHDVISPDDKNNIYEARLSQINAALSKAEADRINLESEYAVTQTGNIDAIAATTPGKYLQPLEERLHQDESQLGALATVYGTRHPLYRQQQQVVQYDQHLLRQGAAHIATQVAAQYRASILQQRLMQTALNQEKAAMDAFNMRAIRYTSLKVASDSATNLYNDLQKSIQDATVAAGLHSEELRIISPAEPNPIPVFPRPLFYGGLAFLGWFALAVVGVVVYGLMDKSLTTPEQVEQALHCRVLAALPAMKAGLQTLSPVRYGLLPSGDGGAGAEPESLERRSTFDEAILGLQSAIQFAGGEIRALAVTSAMPGEGKSTISSHLAAAFASMGKRAVLVDADLRKPNVHRKFQLSNRLGLAAVLRQQAPLSAALQTLAPNLSVLTAGSAPVHGAELLYRGLPEVLEQLRAQFDMVIVDCPPALGFADAAVTANFCDGYVLVANAGVTQRDLVTASMRQMDGVRARLLGVILNRVSGTAGSYYEYFSAYSQYYHEEEELEEAEKD